LQSYNKESDGEIPSNKFVTLDGFKLGSWVANQRFKKAYGYADRKIRLESIPGWSWDPLEGKWNEGFTHLQEFASINKSSNVPNKYKSKDNFKLGSWVGTQRKSQSSLSIERKFKLESLPDWTWDARKTLWEMNYAALVDYVNQYGNPFVPQNYRLKDGSILSSWVDTQVENYDFLDSDKRQRLEALQGWVWSNKSEARWSIGYDYLKEYVSKHDNALVPLRYKTDDGFSLGSWVRTQRGDENLPIDKRGKLEAIKGWTWNAIDEKWEMGFESLLRYV
jgi:hypothetical protein